MGKLLVGLMVLALAASGCTSEAPGQAVSTRGGMSTAPSTSTSTPPKGEVPPINSPDLDLTKYVTRVCDVLTLAQLVPFATKAPGKPRDGIAGPVCSWDPPDTTTGARVTVTIDSKVNYGWDGVYARKNNWAVFENAGEINGYPAVHIGGTKIDFSRGTCLTMVGASRDLVFDLGVFVNDTTSAEYTSPCSVSDKVASLVIDTLKGGR
jgi:uncharacterized protein DUF3558